MANANLYQLRAIKRGKQKSQDWLSAHPHPVFFSVTSDVSYYNEGPISSSKTKDGDVRNKDDQTVIIQDSLPLADSLKVCRRSSIKYLFLFHKIQF